MACFIILMLQEQSDQHKIIHLMDLYYLKPTTLGKFTQLGVCIWILPPDRAIQKRLKNTGSILPHH